MDNLNIQKEAESPSIDSTAGSDTAPAELAVVVDELINQLSTKFSTISSELISKMDDMSRRLDTLEATIQSNSETIEKDESQ